MTDLFLVAHKVRGEPAFDIAMQMECPHCIAQGCHECDELGHWWIIPTSGHRAYPSTFMHLDCVTPAHIEMMKHSNIDNIPDHYPTRAQPTISLAEALGLNKPRPLPPIVRRL